MPNYALDNADIVREAILRQLTQRPLSLADDSPHLRATAKLGTSQLSLSVCGKWWSGVGSACEAAMESKGCNNSKTRLNGNQLDDCPILKPDYVAMRTACPLIPVLEELPTGIIVSDRQGRFTVFNREAERILGFGPRQVGPSLWSEVYGCYCADKATPFPPDDLPLARALRGEEVRGEKIFIRNSAQPNGVWIRASSKPFSATAGVVGSAVVVISDITKSQMALEKIELLSRAVEQTTDSVLITDRMGFIQYVNPAFEITTGYARDEALGSTPRILKSGQHEAGFYRELWRQVVQGSAFRGIIVNRKKTGELFWAEQTITPIRDSAGDISQFVSVMKDITDLRKQQEHEIQLQLARRVQQKFYAPILAWPGLDIGRAVYPAVEIGGDYIDLIPTSSESITIAVGDVSGHGFDSALLMSLTRAYVRSYCAQGFDLSSILFHVNRMLLADLEENRYATLLLLRADSGTGAIHYASAGHVAGVLLDRAGAVQALLESTGMPLGLFPECRVETKRIALSAGDVVLLLTDGVTEASNHAGEQLGLERVIEYARLHRTEPAEQLANGVCQYARAFTRDHAQQDDIATVVLKVI